jgi:restriction system protein
MPILPRPDWEQFRPPEPGVLSGLFGGRNRYATQMADAQAAFARAERERDAEENRRQAWVRDQRAAHAARARSHQAEVEAHNADIVAWQKNCAARHRESVERYLSAVSEGVPLPQDLPRVAEIAYSSRGEQVVARVELPSTDVVPLVARYSYVVSKDERRETARPKAQVAQLYRSIVSQITLLYLRDLFDADPALQIVDVNAHVRATNPATGHLEYPCLISVTVERTVFDGLNLHEVSPQDCLRHLNALVSPHPYEVEPVAPIREFDLTRFAFVDGLDAVSRLDSRPDLMEMTPTEFEHFVRQVFEAMGMEGWTTERTGDDGIDAVVLNRDPIIGGLTVVQAKKYSRVLGVNHIRELVGAMDEKRAGRGILVTTSWFTSGCWTKAKDNGRIELIDGARLVALTRDHLGKNVLITGVPGKRGDRPASSI